VSLYKILLFFHVSDAIKNGTLNLKYSYRYRNFVDYLCLILLIDILELISEITFSKLTLCNFLFGEISLSMDCFF